MKYLATIDNLLIATLWRDVLETAGIRCDIRNRFAGGAVGELPVDQVLPQLWLLDEEDRTTAEQILRDLRHPRRRAAWVCPRCKEKIEGQFSQCWNCQMTRAE